LPAATAPLAEEQDFEPRIRAPLGRGNDGGRADAESGGGWGVRPFLAFSEAGRLPLIRGNGV